MGSFKHSLKITGSFFFLFNKLIKLNVSLLAQGKKKEEKLLLIESGFTLAMEFLLLQTL